MQKVALRAWQPWTSFLPFNLSLPVGTMGMGAPPSQGCCEKGGSWHRDVLNQLEYYWCSLGLRKTVRGVCCCKTFHLYWGILSESARVFWRRTLAEIMIFSIALIPEELAT